MSATEYVILVNENDEETGTAEKLEAHQLCLLHRAFSIFIYRKPLDPGLRPGYAARDDAEVEILLQQRADDKYHAGGLWTNTCCSHPRPKEGILAAGHRRLAEELGLSAALKSLGYFHYTAHFPNGLAENEIDYVLIGQLEANAKITLNPAEVKAYRWVTMSQLKKELHEEPENFTPWLERALELVERELG